MLNNIHPKYALSVIPKKGSPHNPIHNEVDGCMATIIDLTVGKRGWIAFLSDTTGGEDSWHRLHTSPIEKITVGDNGEIEVVTRNTLYFLAPLI